MKNQTHTAENFVSIYNNEGGEVGCYSFKPGDIEIAQQLAEQEELEVGDLVLGLFTTFPEKRHDLARFFAIAYLAQSRTYQNALEVFGELDKVVFPLSLSVGVGNGHIRMCGAHKYKDHDDMIKVISNALETILNLFPGDLKQVGKVVKKTTGTNLTPARKRKKRVKTH